MQAHVRRKKKLAVLQRIFMGIFPTGISYADRTRKVQGDYARLAFLSFRTLELKLARDCPRELRPVITRAAAKVQARRGELFVVDGCGHTVLLGKEP